MTYLKYTLDNDEEKNIWTLQFGTEIVYFYIILLATFIGLS